MKFNEKFYSDYANIDIENNKVSAVMNLTDESTLAQVLHFNHELQAVSESFKTMTENAANKLAQELLQDSTKYNHISQTMVKSAIEDAKKMFVSLVSSTINEVANANKIPQSIETGKKLYNGKITPLDKLNNEKAALFVENKTFPNRQPFSIFANKPTSTQLESTTNNASLDNANDKNEISDLDLANSTFGQSSNTANQFRMQRR